MNALAAHSKRVDDAWRVLHDVLDPEVPAISVTDLGIVRDVIEHADALEVVGDVERDDHRLVGLGAHGAHFQRVEMGVDGHVGFLRSA